jgi:hypothetical protein
MESTEDGDKDVEEDPDGKKETLPTLIDHPEPPFLPECSWLVGSDGLGSEGIGSLEALETPALGFVTLEVGGLGSVGNKIQVRMGVERGLRAVGKVETIVASARHYWWMGRKIQ